MGAEATCVATYAGQTSSGKALLETDYLLFRGDFRLRIAYADIHTVESTGGRLNIEFGDQAVTLELGRNAESWANKIRAPKSRLDKLGVKSGQSITALGIGDENFLLELRDRTNDVATDRRKKRRDIAFLGIENASDFPLLRSMEELLTTDGALWVIYPKGQTHIRETDVLAAGRDAGLVDVKVMRFSDSHTALKFMIRAARRKTMS